MSEDDITQFFCVVYERKKRLCTCEHRHLTRESADACVKENNGLTIIEWVRDRDPQFQEVWSSPELLKERN